MATNQLLNTFNFEISLLKSAQIDAGSNTDDLPESSSDDTLGNGGFQECSGLELAMDVQQLQEGGRNDGVIQQVGYAKYQNIVLKRGMFYNQSNKLSNEIWAWIQGVLSGQRPVARYDGLINIYSNKGATADPKVIASWRFDRALPVKVAGPQLNAKSGDLAIEELHLAHEGLRMDIKK